MIFLTIITRGVFPSFFVLKNWQIFPHKLTKLVEFTFLRKFQIFLSIVSKNDKFCQIVFDHHMNLH
jgi:hypothetical protein